ncbi:hypothetical protein FF011L_12140 [Roseimaritima multifibrata]|uniref:PIN domain-containing protein n=1 Tax=Roseimaritima multifibrata TaxID=1930274 RepID=A0A517MC72_9BACT|nr:GreA/GreB family elongation factor [Roseimaritima multifibrata]QDS92471.1 hypothetical protein FF011L_12140 [Roseimaritima multifibrata]
MTFSNQFAHDEEFADFCVRLLKAVLKCESFEKYAKRGESQNGIDIIDMAHGTPLRAAQCKLHEPHKTCPPAEIREEVRKAASCDFKLDEFYILTAAKKTRYTDNAVLEINRDREHGQSFTTFVWTWQEIETKLRELDPVARDRVQNAGKNGSVESFRAVMKELMPEFAANSVQSGNYILQSKFKLIETHLKNHDRSLAKYELEQIDAMPAENQSSDDRYLVHRFNAKYLMLVGQFDEAAHRFLEAYDARPELDQARINRSLALELLGKKAKAWEQASELLREGIRTEPLPTIAYRNAPRPHSDEVKSWYEDQLDTSEELNLTLADEAREDERPEDSIRYSNRAIEINNDSARGYLLRGFAHHNLALSGDPKLKAERLVHAERDYLLVHDMTVEPLPDGLVADVCRNLGNVRFLLGRPNAAEAFEEAIHKADQKGPYVEQCLSFLCSTRKFKTANRILQEHGIDDANLNQRFLKLVVARYNREPDSDVDFIGAMLDLFSEGEFQRRDECLGFVAQWSIDDCQTQEAIVQLDALKDRLDPFEFECCMAWLQHVSKNSVAAKKHAAEAKRNLRADSPENYIGLLAQVFIDLDEDAQALPLLQQRTDSTRLNSETKTLLDCAQRLQQHDVMLKTCELLRANKADNEATRSLEMQILFAYTPKKAAALIHELVVEHPNDRSLYAWLCLTETRLNGGYDQLDESRLPMTDDVSAYESKRVLIPLIALERYSAAVRYAYDVLRFNQGDELSHSNYLWLFMEHARKSDLDLDATVVRLDCAVTFREFGGDKKTVIIEQHVAEQRFDGEIAEDSGFAQAIIGKNIGDIAVISPESIQPREITIEAISSKFVYRYQRVLTEFQLRFPHSNTIQMLRVLDGEDMDLSPIRRSLEERRKHCESILALFRNHPLPISALAEWLGIGFYDAHEVLASMPDIGIRASFDLVKLQGKELATNSFTQNQHLVLDLSAVITIEKLGLWKSLRTYQLVATRSVFEHFRLEAENLSVNRSTGTLTLAESGQVAFQEISEGESHTRIEVANGIVDNIKQHCTVVDSFAAASVALDLREAFDDVGAFPVLDSMAVADNVEGYLLWSDEAFVQTTALHDFELPSIGVQKVLAQLRKDGAITPLQRDEFVAKLMGWNYTPMLWDSYVALAAARLSNWEPTKWPFTSIIEQFGKNSWTLRAKCKLALRLFIKLYSATGGNVSETQLLLAVMNAIGVSTAADLIRADAFEASRPNQEMLDSITVSLNVWKGGWLGR